MTGIYLLTGSYSSSHEQGIKLWEFNPVKATCIEKTGIGGIERPSFIAAHPNGVNFVATSEVEDGELVSYRLDLENNLITEINRQSANGAHPSHVCIDVSGKWLLSTNYSGGNVNVYPIQEDGSIGERTDSIKHEGSGANVERQDAPHPHSVFQQPGSNDFFVSDLGADMIAVYELDRETGKLKLKKSILTTPGSGPRHLAFHPEMTVVYSLEELSSTLSVYEIGGEDFLEFVQVVELIPKQFAGTNTSAEVVVSEDGQHLYASNRGHDSIAVFAIQEKGILKFEDYATTGGAGPRHFTLLPGKQWLAVANEKSDSINMLKIGASGIPEEIIEPVSTNAPVCIKVIG
ncbi:lactonase family protein [Planococcus sp. 1R117A]|uniref:lactonase family protein n=1 Tax=Planococcus sp. 1R117A TaxID=3447020 RepID=UPI003EDBB20C